MYRVTGATVESRDDSGIFVEGNRYSTYKGVGLEEIKAGDKVDFFWEFDKKTGKYRNIQKGTIQIITKGVATTSSPTTYNPKTYSSLGVELGHASKLGLDIAMKMVEEKTVSTNVGSDDFYKLWVQHTDKVYNIMRRLREAKEHDVGTHAPKKEEPILASEEKISIFD